MSTSKPPDQPFQRVWLREKAEPLCAPGFAFTRWIIEEDAESWLTKYRLEDEDATLFGKQKYERVEYRAVANDWVVIDGTAE